MLSMKSSPQLDMFLNISSIILFISMFVLLFIWFVFYKKHTSKLDAAFSTLINEGFIGSVADNFYAGLGFLGFANRAYLLSRIINGKPHKIDRNKYLDSRAKELLMARFDFKWLKSFSILYYSSLTLVALMALVVFIDKTFSS